jgi:hypothetical protein
MGSRDARLDTHGAEQLDGACGITDGTGMLGAGGVALDDHERNVAGGEEHGCGEAHKTSPDDDN